jgi:hypothetical protein
MNLDTRPRYPAKAHQPKADCVEVADFPGAVVSYVLGTHIGVLDLTRVRYSTYAPAGNLRGSCRGMSAGSGI